MQNPIHALYDWFLANGFEPQDMDTQSFIDAAKQYDAAEPDIEIEDI